MGSFVGIKENKPVDKTCWHMITSRCGPPERVGTYIRCQGDDSKEEEKAEEGLGGSDDEIRMGEFSNKPTGGRSRMFRPEREEYLNTWVMRGGDTMHSP